MMNTSFGRGATTNQRSCSIMSPIAREKRTADVVKSVLSKVKERLLVSGPLLTEEETAINQLEQLYVAKFLRSDHDHENGNSASSSQASDAKRKQSDQCPPTFASIFSSRRDSDASFSNDTHMSTSSKRRTAKDKDRDYYSGRDPWRRQWQRKKRLELRRLVEPLPLRVDEASDDCLVRAVASVYDGLLMQGKTPLAAYDLLITTLRSHFARETWPDLVDPYVIQFVQNHLLRSASEITEKYSSGVAAGFERIYECKLQALLHLFALPLGAKGDKLEKVADVLRQILPSFDGINILQRFLDEDILESFLDIMPRDLATLYQELNISLPTELNAYASEEKSDAVASSGDTKSKPLNENHCISPTGKKLGRSRTIKRTVEAKSPNGKQKAVSASGAKRVKVEPIVEDIEEVVEPPPTVVEKPESNDRASLGRPKKSKIASTHGVGKIIAEEASTSSVLVSVRQSPRHHASTRALYGSTANTLSLLLQKEQADGNRNDCLEIPTTTGELLNESTRLVLVKDKRGYFFKKFLHDGNNGKDDEEEDDDAHIADVMPLKKLVSKKATGIKIKMAKRVLKLERQKSTEKSIGKLKLTLKKDGTGKKVSATLDHSKTPINGKKSCQQKKPSKKSNNGRVGDHHRIVIAKVASKGSDTSPSFILSTNLASPSRNSEKGTRQHASSTRKNDHSSSELKMAAKNSKSIPIDLEKSDVVVSKTSKGKSERKSNATYALPSFAAENYIKHVNDIRRERKRARIDPGDETELFYARGTRRHSIFYDGGDDANTRPPISKCYSDEQMAPKNRSGRKMKSSVEVFHLANYLLNVQNENPSAPAVPKNLQQALNTPIRLYKKLRLAPKNSRRRSLRQFCALKFNADEFKLSLDNGSGTSNSSTADEERSANETDECASLELNCGEPLVPSSKEEPRHNDLKMTLTIDTRFADHSPRRNSVSVCAGLAKWPARTWNVNGMSMSNCDQTEKANGYFLRRRRLFSDGHVATVGSSVVSPVLNGTKRTISLKRRGGEFEDVKIKLKDAKIGKMETERQASIDSDNGMAVPEKEFIMIADSPLRGQILDQHSQVREDDGAFLNRLSSHAGGLLQLANSSPLLCTGLASKNYAQVAADVR